MEVNNINSFIIETKRKATYMKRKKQQRKVQRAKEEGYIQRWSPHDQKKQYTALQDPHANYYFYNKSVNQHLKQLKKAITHEKNAKQKQKLRQQISQKLTAVKLPNIKLSPKAAIYATQIDSGLSKLSKHLRKRSECTIISHHKEKETENKNQTSFSVVEMRRYRKTHLDANKSQISENQNQTDDNFKAKKAEKNLQSGDVQKIHQESHVKFLQFLVQKKKKIELTEANIQQLLQPKERDSITKTE